MPLATARKEARARRVMIDQGRNPLGEQRAREAKETQRGGFGKVANDWFEREIKPKYAKPQAVRAALDNHIIPKIGRDTLQDITPADCERVLNALREDSPTMANDVLRYLKRIFAYAKRRHLITNSPISDFDPSRDAAARWAEFDLEGKGTKGAVWRLPADRTKTASALEIPLAPQVVSWLRVLHTLASGNGYVFPKRRRDPRARQDHIGLDTLNVALTRIEHGLEAFTLHDLRRTARTHLAGLGVRTEVAERCLNHKVRGVVGIYDRHDYYTERRQALTAWAAQLDRFERGSANVVKLSDEAHRRTA